MGRNLLNLQKTNKNFLVFFIRTSWVQNPENCLKAFSSYGLFIEKSLSGEEIYCHTMHFCKRFNRGKGRVYDVQETAAKICLHKP